MRLFSTFFFILLAASAEAREYTRPETKVVAQEIAQVLIRASAKEPWPDGLELQMSAVLEKHYPGLGFEISRIFDGYMFTAGGYESSSLNRFEKSAKGELVLVETITGVREPRIYAPPSGLLYAQRMHEITEPILEFSFKVSRTEESRTVIPPTGAASLITLQKTVSFRRLLAVFKKTELERYEKASYARLQELLAQPIDADLPAPLNKESYALAENRFDGGDRVLSQQRSRISVATAAKSMLGVFMNECGHNDDFYKRFGAQSAAWRRELARAIYLCDFAHKAVRERQTLPEGVTILSTKSVEERADFAVVAQEAALGSGDHGHMDEAMKAFGRHQESLFTQEMVAGRNGAVFQRFAQTILLSL